MPLVFVVGSERFPLEKERIVVGRDPACDIVLDREGIEPRHVEIAIGDAPIITKLAGDTSVGDVALGKLGRLLRPGDVLRLGSVDAAVELDDTSPLLDTRQLALAAVRRVKDATLHATVVVVEGAESGRRLELVDDARAYRIGRGKQCELALTDDLLSREHVRVVRRGADVFISDLDSTRGTFLGASRLAPWRDVKWNISKMVRIADTVIALRLPMQTILEAVVEKRVADAEPTQSETPHAPDVAKPVEAKKAAGIVGAPTTREKRPKPPSLQWLVPAAVALVMVASLAMLVWILK